MDPIPPLANGQLMAPILHDGQEIPAIPHDVNDGHDLDEGWGNDLNVSQNSSNSSFNLSDLMGSQDSSVPNTSFDSGLTPNMQDQLNAHMMNDHSISSFGTDQSQDRSLSTISGNSDSDISMMSVGSNSIFGDDDDDDDDEDDPNNQNGGKRRKRKSNKRRKQKGKKGGKTRKIRRRRIQKGGVCYGNGVGANNYDPNFSIYNTNLTKLFPYRPQ